MSVEIDVGLENAANVKVPHGETQKLDLGRDSLVSFKLRLRLITGGVILLAALLGLYLYFHNRESTDDAQVDGHVNGITARIDGVIKAVYVEENQSIQAAQLVAEMDPRDYQVALAADGFVDGAATGRLRSTWQSGALPAISPKVPPLRSA